MTIALILLGVLSVGSISVYMAEIGHEGKSLLVFCVCCPVFIFGLFAYFGALE